MTDKCHNMRHCDAPFGQIRKCSYATVIAIDVSITRATLTVAALRCWNCFAKKKANCYNRREILIWDLSRIMYLSPLTMNGARKPCDHAETSNCSFPRSKHIGMEDDEIIDQYNNLQTFEKGFRATTTAAEYVTYASAFFPSENYEKVLWLIRFDRFYPDLW